MMKGLALDLVFATQFIRMIEDNIIKMTGDLSINRAYKQKGGETEFFHGSPLGQQAQINWH